MSITADFCTTQQTHESRSHWDRLSEAHRQVRFERNPTTVNLTPEHEQHLINSAVTPEIIATSGVYSGVHYERHGIFFPWNDGSGEVLQHRPDEPRLNADGDPVKYEFPKGARIPFNHLRVTGAPYVLLVEGTKQALAALSHTPTTVDVIGMSGCWGWHDGEAKTAKPMHWALGKTVMLAIDADMSSNRQVWAAAKRLTEALNAAGADEVRYVVTPGTGTDGLDDVLASYPEDARSEAMRGFLKNAGKRLPARPKAKAPEAAAVRVASDSPFDAPSVAELGPDVALSDRMMAERVVAEELDGRMLFSPELGWLVWNGKVWIRADDTEAVRVVGGYLKRWVAAETVNPTIQASSRDRAKLLSNSGINAIVAQCKGLVATAGDLFDQHPDLLTCDNGVIDLRTGELLAFDHKRLMTTFAPTAYRPGARHADVDMTLSAMGDDVRRYMQVSLGQGITGHAPKDDVLRLLHGGGANGKSNLISGLGSTLGVVLSNGAMRMVNKIVLMGDKDAKEEMMAFRGARLVFIEELPEGAHLNVTRLKDTVGTEYMMSRHLYKSEIRWRATHSFYLTTNYKPQVAETDHGTWRRLALVPFPYKFVPGKPQAAHERRGDGGLKSRIRGREQREALLAWLVEGSVAWYADGDEIPAPPVAVLSATEAWRGESDMVVKFWSEQLVADPDSHIMGTELTEAMNAYLESEGKAKWGTNVMASRFGGHDYTVRAGVEKRSQLGVKGVSRREGSSLPVPSRHAGWVGVRFRTNADDVAQPVADPVEPSGVVLEELWTATEAPVRPAPVPEVTTTVNESQTALYGSDGDPFAAGLGLNYEF